MSKLFQGTMMKFKIRNMVPRLKYQNKTSLLKLVRKRILDGNIAQEKDNVLWLYVLKTRTKM